MGNHKKRRSRIHEKCNILLCLLGRRLLLPILFLLLSSLGPRVNDHFWTFAFCSTTGWMTSLLINPYYPWVCSPLFSHYFESPPQLKQTKTELAPKAPKIGVFRIENAIFRCFLYQNRRRRRRKILRFFRINKRFRINKCAWLAGGMGNRGCWTQSLIPSP